MPAPTLPGLDARLTDIEARMDAIEQRVTDHTTWLTTLYDLLVAWLTSKWWKPNRVPSEGWSDVVGTLSTAQNDTVVLGPPPP